MASQATRPRGSSARTASRTASEIWSAILSGWPSVTDSEVKRKVRSAIGLTVRTLPFVAGDPAGEVRLGPAVRRRHDARPDAVLVRLVEQEVLRRRPSRQAEPRCDRRD